MKILKLKISNFRGLRGDANIIDFKDSNIIFLIGQNNVGKSTFLRAYEFFTNSKQVANIEDFCDHDNCLPIEIEGYFLKEEGDDNNDDLKQKSKEPNWLDKWTDEDSIIRVKKVWDTPNQVFKKYTFQPNDNWVQNGFGGIDSLFTTQAPTPIAINAMESQVTLEEKVNKLIQDDFIKKIKENYLDSYNELVEGVKRLQSLITGSEAVESMNVELNQHFNELFSTLTLKIQPAKDENIKLEDAFKKNHSLIVERDKCARKETVLQNGHGVIRQALFNFMTFLKRGGVSNQKKYIILFEEPELFLHPKIAFKLRESLYDLADNSPYQILCATHSPLMIDISRPHSSLIRISKDENEHTCTHQVGDSLFSKNDELKKLVQMVNRFNPHICEAFYADRVLLVEGDTETIVYRDLLSRFYPHEEIFVLNTGSKMNIPFFQEVLIHFNIEHYVIHDTDSEKSKNGNANPAWSMNDKIWDLIKKANIKQMGLSRRYVHFRNFEEAHGIILYGNKDKPLKAYEFAKGLNLDSDDCPCLDWLKDIVGEKKINHTPEFIVSNIKSMA